jgi:hypothetical protein
VGFFCAHDLRLEQGDGMLIYHEEEFLLLERRFCISIVRGYVLLVTIAFRLFVVCLWVVCWSVALLPF